MRTTRSDLIQRRRSQSSAGSRQTRSASGPSLEWEYEERRPGDWKESCRWLPAFQTKSLCLLFSGAELFRVPPNVFQGSFELLEPVWRDFGEGSSNISSVLPKDRADELLATRSESDD